MRATHTIIVGETESGKSVCAKKIAASYKAHGIGVVVLDPYKDPAWNADFITKDPAEFMALVRDPDQCLQCAIFVDEAGRMLGRYDEEFNWLTCESRHLGHVAHLISQRAQHISPNVRTQCATLYCFRLAPKDAKQYAEDFNCLELLKASELPQGHCIRVQRFQPTQYLRMW